MTVIVYPDAGPAHFRKFLEITKILHENGWVYIYRGKECLYQSAIGLVNLDIR